MLLPLIATNLQAECGVSFTGVEPRHDAFGGVGLFATRRLQPSEVIATIPWTSCITGQGNKDEQRVGVASKLALARAGHGSPAWCAYADTLSWDLASWHPLVGDATNAVVTRMVDGARWATSQVVKETDLDADHCFEAVLAVCTRAFDLSHLSEGCVAALVPFAEFVNHPSYAVMTPAFAAVPVSGAVVGTTWDEDQVCLRAPRELGVEEGDELFGWYGNAGAGTKDPVLYHARRTEFLFQYGFDPFDDSGRPPGELVAEKRMRAQ